MKLTLTNNETIDIKFLSFFKLHFLSATLMLLIIYLILFIISIIKYFFI